MLPRPSTDWMKSTHIMDNEFSIIWFNLLNQMFTSSKKALTNTRTTFAQIYRQPPQQSSGQIKLTTIVHLFDLIPFFILNSNYTGAASSWTYWGIFLICVVFFLSSPWAYDISLGLLYEFLLAHHLSRLNIDLQLLAHLLFSSLCNYLIIANGLVSSENLWRIHLEMENLFLLS